MRRIPLRSAAIATVVAFLCGMLTWGVLTEPSMRVWASPSSAEDDELLDLFGTVLDIITDRALQPVDRDDLLRAAIHGMVASLDDPYAEFIDKESLASMMEDYRNEGYAGVGLRMISAPEGAQILDVFPGAPASRAGLRPGDIIVRVDGIDLAGMDLTEIGSLIRGPEGSSVLITVVRAGEEMEPVSPRRETVVRPTVSFEQVELDGLRLGYVAIDRFTESTPDEMKWALESLDVEGLLVDLRGNPGGILSSAIEVTEHLVPPGPILKTITADGVLTEYESQTPGIDTPVVFLVDDYTASGSEILAGAARDRLNATLVGTHTYGKGVVQSLYDLGEGGLRLTTAEFVLPSGTRIAGEGLSPDILIFRSGATRSGADPLPMGEAPLGPGDEGTEVFSLQWRLQGLGYLSDGLTGRYDGRTRVAVAAFQGDEGVRLTGIADQTTLERLAQRTDSPAPELDLDGADLEELLPEEDWLLRDRQLLYSMRVLQREVAGR